MRHLDFDWPLEPFAIVGGDRVAIFITIRLQCKNVKRTENTIFHTPLQANADAIFRCAKREGILQRIDTYTGLKLLLTTPPHTSRSAAARMPASH